MISRQDMVLENTNSEPRDEIAAQEARFELAKKILGLFLWERRVYLMLNAVTFAVLIGAAVFVVLKRNMDKGELSLICGSGGLIGFTSSRLLAMWRDVMNRVLGRS